ncbi:ABC transporter permease subunit [Hymenobacter edaphi]|uniref:ABC transporter permease n=1 Tax=Hymenobacter edaphi TaxID=2211146 RepID=A0A328BTH3_9BACT|nr:ABC transporter permease subunit [Hymenobacter edaphi]RAK69899.1 ABC transporter permease [Hymenobacter edaphi]
MLRTELRKLLPYRTAWVILLLFTGLLAATVAGAGGVNVNGQQLGQALYALPGLWPNLTYLASYFSLLPAFLLIMLITDEFQYRTLRQQVIDGASREQLVLDKLLVAGLLVAWALLSVLLVGAYFGLTRAPNASLPAVLAAAPRPLLLYAAQLLGYLSLAALLAVLIRKSTPAIVALLLYVWVVERLIRYFLPDSIDRFLPIKALDILTPSPFAQTLDTVLGPSGALLPGEAVPVALAWAAGFWLLSAAVLRTRDL